MSKIWIYWVLSLDLIGLCSAIANAWLFWKMRKVGQILVAQSQPPLADDRLGRYAASMPKPGTLGTAGLSPTPESLLPVTCGTCRHWARPASAVGAMPSDINPCAMFGKDEKQRTIVDCRAKFTPITVYTATDFSCALHERRRA